MVHQKFGKEEAVYKGLDTNGQKHIKKKVFKTTGN